MKINVKDFEVNTQRYREHYAWFPVVTKEGSFAWFEKVAYVEEYMRQEKAFGGHFYGWEKKEFIEPHKNYIDKQIVGWQDMDRLYYKRKEFNE